MSTASSAARIASVSGAVTDRRHGFAEVAAHEDVGYIVGDWMSEYNMTTRGAAKSGGDGSGLEFEPCFLESIFPALEHLAARRIKVAVNAGASDTCKLYEVLQQEIDDRSLDLKVAWVEGDEVMDAVSKAIDTGSAFKSLTTGKTLKSWNFKPVYAQCYLGAFGIVEAFNQGADIVVGGRVADASPIIACATYHHQWKPADLPQLAHALVAGHLIECSAYVTGGNFTGFKSLPQPITALGFPIAAITADGTFTVTKQQNRGGMVTVDTCKAQLLYEIQGPYYYNSDVVAKLSDIKMEQLGPDEVRVSNVGPEKPPPTTKVGLTAHGGYQAEAHYFICGLDIAEKAAMLEVQIRFALDESRFHTLKFRTTGSCMTDPTSQDAATVDFRIFAQSTDESALSTANFLRPCMDTIMQSFPGATFAVDTRQADPKPYYEYWVTVLPQSEVKHVCHVPWKDTLEVAIDPPTDTVDFQYEQDSYETADPVDTASFGPIVRAPLGHVVHARSGDKGSDCNVGFFVRHADEWEWLQSTLTVDKIKQLLGKDYIGKPILRFELPNLWAVHFLLKDHLDRGVSSSSTYDVLGKMVAEYLRCKHVDIPKRFYDRGRI